VKANSRDIETGLDLVSVEVLPYFEETALEILEKYETKEALCRALAMITGYTEIF